MLVVFDLDDTLYLEADFVRSGFKAVDAHLRAQGSHGFSDIAWALFQSGVRRTIFDQALTRLGHRISPSLLQELVDVYRAHDGDIRLAEDSERCLRSMEGRVDLGMITDGPSIAQWNKVRMLGLATIFKDIVVTEDLGPEAGKPSPIAFKKLQGTRSGATCAYIADNPCKDFLAPKELGWRTIRIRRPRGLHYDKPDELGAVADYHLPDLSQLPSIVEQWKSLKTKELSVTSDGLVT